ncbi:His-Xaa-Ser system protein HxsD [Oleiagrimonas soli]|uniref:His-Xaa-Ser system protein HxsD n=1 Tax=Oleiagrimonas soli TaxID=1543381 RepID=A0A099CUY2_9GAMM|nr:His-Xaa-Ser system protein HxsD [Oleiagrimonas soli]KGI77574.1 hypothetical protein LF63_0109655 [Oleiagrimonas soli]MBB6182942.1 His-Xaa-Ser system protein HxsD [Oleiagrimonas soli]
MDAIEISLEGGVFSADAVVRTTHRYTADYYINILSSEGNYTVRLTPKSAEVDTSALVGQFRNDLLDEQLRESVRTQTKELHDTLVKAALLKAEPLSPDPAP